MLCLFCFSFDFSKLRVTIKKSLIIKISTGLAFMGLSIVLLTILLNFLDVLNSDQRTMAFVVGFTAMLLGTIWKVVLEMNQEE